MMQYLTKGLVVCLWLISAQLHAEMFLNDPVLVTQAQDQGKVASQGVKAMEPLLNDEYDANIEESTSPLTSRPYPIDPGFTPSHEVMRETEAKREANDRLWQSIFSAF